jgi:hypothetical protein
MSEWGVTARQKESLANQAGRCCEYCRAPSRYSASPFSIDHVIPQARGGATVNDNLAYACQGCNSFKYTKTTAIDPISNVEVPLFHPRRQRWSEHFAWNADATLIIGVTATGRATVEALRLNRQELVNLRRVLYQMAEHPPVEPVDR